MTDPRRKPEQAAWRDEIQRQVDVAMLTDTPDTAESVQLSEIAHKAGADTDAR